MGPYDLNAATSQAHSVLWNNTKYYATVPVPWNDPVLERARKEIRHDSIQ